MKQRTSILLALLLTAFLVAFSTGSAQSDETVTIGVSIPTADHGWTGGINYWAAQTEERLEATYPNLDIIIATAANPSEQASDLEDLVAINQIDALVILPYESDPLTDPVANLKNQGVFVTVVDRGLARDDIADVYVAGNNPALGRISGEYFAERLGGQDANIVILRGLPVVIDTERFDAFMEAIEGSGINVLDSAYADWNRDKGFEIMQDFLARFPDIDGVWAQDDDVAEGAIEAIMQAGREDELFIVGGAGKKEIIKRVLDNDPLVPVDVLYPPAMIGTAMEVTALRYTSDTPILGEYILDAPLITPENAEQYYFPDSLY